MLTPWKLPGTTPTNSFIRVTETVLITAMYNDQLNEIRAANLLKLKKDRTTMKDYPTIKTEYLNKTGKAPLVHGAYWKHLFGDTLGGRYFISLL